MIIGVDASCWANKRGYGRYTRELLTALFDADQRNEYRLFIDTESAKQAVDLPEGIPQVRVNTSKAATQAASAAGRRSLRDIWAMRQAVNRYGSDLDVFYFPSVYTYFPVKTRAKVIVTIHDTTAERYPKLIFPNRLSRLFWNLKVQMAVRRADLIATVSEASKIEIVREFGVAAEQVRVVSDAVGPEFYRLNPDARTPDARNPDARTPDARTREVLAKYGVNIGLPFILYVGGISPHKNLITLVRAHAALQRVAGGVKTNLVLLGDYQKDVFYSSYSDLCREIEHLGTKDWVVFTGFVDDADLVHFYNGASTLVMPSFDEGFGLPALEAMACGTPVIASRAGALPEVVGNAGKLFNPHDPDELKVCLSDVLGDARLHQEMSRQGLQRAREFSWARSADSALAIFEEVAASLEPVTA